MTIDIYEITDLKNSKGVIIKKGCVNTLIYSATCLYMIDVTDKYPLTQKIGLETNTKIIRVDFKGFNPNIKPLQRAKFTDSNNILHDYKIISVKNRAVLGCNWVTMYLENIEMRDKIDPNYISSN